MRIIQSYAGRATFHRRPQRRQRFAGVKGKPCTLFSVQHLRKPQRTTHRPTRWRRMRRGWKRRRSYAMFHLLYEQIIAGTYFETRSARFMGAYVVVSLPSTTPSTPHYKSENVRRRRLRMFGQRNRGSRDKMPRCQRPRVQPIRRSRPLE